MPLERRSEMTRLREELRRFASAVGRHAPSRGGWTSRAAVSLRGQLHYNRLVVRARCFTTQRRSVGAGRSLASPESPGPIRRFALAAGPDR